MKFDNYEQFGRRAAACKHWRWMPGMIAIRDASMARRILSSAGGYGDLVGWFPDLTDPATVGCLHQITCEAHNAFQIRIQVHIAPDMSGRDGAFWTAVDRVGRRVFYNNFRTTPDIDPRVSGLVEALEAAP